MKVGFFLSVLCLFESSWAGPIEDWVEASADPDAVQEWLDELRSNPMDLNSASPSEIAGLPFFDNETAQELARRRTEANGFTQMRQVLALPNLTDSQRESLNEFAKVRPVRSERASVSASRYGSEHTVKNQMRGSFRQGERVKGFLRAVNNGSATDFSAGAEFSRDNGVVRILAGDFQVESATGLVFAAAFGGAGWITSRDLIKPSAAHGLQLRPTSDHRSRLRGIATELRNRYFSATIIGSANRLDAATVNGRVVRITEGETSDGSLARSRNDQIEERLGGVVLHAGVSSVGVDFSAAHSRFSNAISPGASWEEPKPFSGSSLNVASLSIGGSFRRLNILSEAAMSDPGGYAHQSVLAVSGGALQAALYHIFAAPDYYSLRSRIWSGFGDEARNEQQTGCKLRAVWSVATLGLHAWSARTPFRTQSFPLARHAAGIEVQSQFEFSSRLAILMLARRELKYETANGSSSSLQVNRARIEALLPGSTELRFRVEMKTAGIEGSSSFSHGTLSFAQVRQLWGRTALFVRISVFHADDGTVAVRAYENAPLSVFPVVDYSGSGRRLAMMMSRDVSVLSGTVKLGLTDSDTRTSRPSLDSAMQLTCRW